MTDTTKQRARPTYEALDAEGRPYIREARTIGELNHIDRSSALEDAIPALSAALGMEAVEKLSFGAPVYEAFGLNRKSAAHHDQKELLFTLGCDLNLDHVPRYKCPT